MVTQSLPEGSRLPLFRSAALAGDIIANSWQQTPRDWIKMVVVGDAFDAADDYIAEECTGGDLSSLQTSP